MRAPKGSGPRAELALLLWLAACGGAPHAAPLVEGPREPPASEPAASAVPSQPHYTIKRDPHTARDRLVASGPAQEELFVHEDVKAFTLGPTGELFVVSWSKGELRFSIERLSQRGDTLWKKPVPIQATFYTDVRLKAVAGRVVFTAQPYGEAAWAWSVSSETGDPEAEPTSLRGTRIDFIDERAVLWTTSQDRVVRRHPTGAPLSSTTVTVPPADAAASLGILSLFPTSDGGAVAVTEDGRLVGLDEDGRTSWHQSLPEPVHEVVGRGPQRALCMNTRFAQLDASGKPTWQWQAPRGRILSCREQKDGAAAKGSAPAPSTDPASAPERKVVLDLAIGVRVVLDAAGQLLGAHTIEAWGEPKAEGLPIDLRNVSFRHGQLGVRFDRVGAGAPMAVDTAGIYRLDALGSIQRVDRRTLSTQTLTVTHGNKQLTKHPLGAMSGKELYVWSANYQEDVMDSWVTGVELYRLQDKRLLLDPAMSFRFEQRSRLAYTALGADEGTVAACASEHEGTSSCRIKTQAGVVRHELDRTVAALAVQGGEVFALLRDYKKETQLRVLRGGEWQDLGLHTRAPGYKLGLSGPADIWVLASDAYQGAGSRMDQALFHYDGAHWTALPTPMGDVRDLLVRGRDDLWVVGPEGVARWDGKGWTLADGPSAELTAIGEGPDGTIVLYGPSGTWLGRAVAGDVVARDATDDAVLREGEAAEIRSLAPTRGAQKLSKVSFGLKADQTKAKRTVLASVLASAVAPDGTLWLADEQSLFVLEAGQARYVGSHRRVDADVELAPLSRSKVVLPEGILDAFAKGKLSEWGASNVRALAVSPTGRVWTALLPSLESPRVLLQSSQDGVVRHYPAVPEWTNTSISARGDGDVWLVGGIPGTSRKPLQSVETSDWPVGEGGLLHYDGTKFTATRVATGSLLVVAAIQDHEAWAGGAGAALVHATADATEVFVPEDRAAGSIRTILAESPQSVWFAGDDRLVLHWDGKGFTSLDTGDLARNTTFTTSFLQDGKVHLAGPSGIYRVE